MLCLATDCLNMRSLWPFWCKEISLGESIPIFMLIFHLLHHIQQKKTACLRSPDSTSEALVVCEKQFFTDFLSLNQWEFSLFFLILNGISTFFPYLWFHLCALFYSKTLLPPLLTQPWLFGNSLPETPPGQLKTQRNTLNITKIQYANTFNFSL